MLRRSLLTLGFASTALLLTSAVSTAHPPVDPRPPIESSGRYGIHLEDPFGRRLPTFHHRGQSFVMGSFGERYGIVVRNHTGRRVEAVVTVDGRDVVSGRPGDFVRQRGYVLAPYGSVTITGFRQSFERVAAFRFTSPHDSYSARMGTPENVGVIGVAFFEEDRPAPWPLTRDDYHREAPRSSERRNPNPRAGGSAPKSRSRSESYAPSPEDAERAPRRPSAPRNNLGTEYGESRSSRAYEVTFRRRHPTTPDTVLTLRYDDARGLEARGIDVYPWREPPVARPQAFPNSRFAPPPW